MSLANKMKEERDRGYKKGKSDVKNMDLDMITRVVNADADERIEIYNKFYGEMHNEFFVEGWAQAIEESYDKAKKELSDE